MSNLKRCNTDREPRSTDPTSMNVHGSAAATVATIRRIKSEDLFQQMSEVEIEHGERVYRLRITQYQKLILTA